MNGAALIVGYCTGMVLTRRTAPLGGAGTLTLILPLTIWASGAPLATAITGVAAYRLLCFWLTLPPSLASLPVLREATRPAPAAPPGQPARPIVPAAKPGERDRHARASGVSKPRPPSPPGGRHPGRPQHRPGQPTPAPRLPGYRPLAARIRKSPCSALFHR